MTDTGYAADRWAFDDKVTAVFENMLERSIPQYKVMRKACYDVANRYVQKATQIVDLGCSRGSALASLVDKYGAANRFIAADVSTPMLDACRERFKGYIDAGVVQVKYNDLRYDPYPATNASLTLCVLTLQFTPLEYRQAILNKIYESTVPGGALILVEKILGSTLTTDTLLVDIYYDMKNANGYTKDEIQRKRLSLEGVLVPVTSAWNEALLRDAGFGMVECFWRWMNFAAWVAVKPRKSV